MVVVLGHRVVVFPARAGMSPVGLLGMLRRLGVPRASGDEPQNAEEIHDLNKCSPRERG